MTRPARFTQSDIERAMKAAKRSGYPAARVILKPSGEIEIVTSTNPPPANDEEDFDL